MSATRILTYSQIKGSSVALPCVVATQSAITLSGTQTINGVSVSVGDRVLVTQNGSDNGIYIVASGPWSRAVDMSTNEDVFQGLNVFVSQGTTKGYEFYTITSANPVNLNNIVFADQTQVFGSSGTSGTSGDIGSSGASGSSGGTGFGGTSGADGESGSSGTSGSSGVSGTNGTSGTSASSGSSGTSGISDSSGTAGTSGNSDVSGDSGSSGTSGTNGTNGTSGTSATSGSSGTSASSGTAGTSGTSGTSGLSATSGSSGSSGTSGTSASSGTSGLSQASGSAAPSATSGSAGTSGTTGVAGGTGPQGATGPQGGTGPQGPRGTQGATGASPTGPQGPRGPQGGTGPNGPQGPVGATGPQGFIGPAPTGPTGFQGPQGSSGPFGPPGPSGASGVSGTISTGTTNYFAKYTASTTLGNSLLTNGTNVNSGNWVGLNSVVPYSVGTATHGIWGGNSLGPVYQSGVLYGNNTIFKNWVVGCAGMNYNNTVSPPWISSNSGWGGSYAGAIANDSGAGIEAVTSNTRGPGFVSVTTRWITQGNSFRLAMYTTNGTLTTTGGTGRFAVSSDGFMKIHDGFIENGREMMMKLIPRYYYWKDTEKFGSERQLGFYAQEVSDICEEAANKPKWDEQGWGIYNRSLIAILVKASQERQEELNILIKELEYLELEYEKIKNN
jgi:hypothetical protein